MMGLGIFSLTGIFVVAMWPREKSSRFEEQSEHVTVKSVLLNFRPPRHAPDFYYALVGRTLMMGGYWMITTYQLYIAQDYIYAGDPNAKDKAATIIATMGVITLVVSLIAAVTAGPITDRLGRRKLPVALASCLFAVGAAMPLFFRSPMGMYLFAAVAGLGYGVYNAIDQAQRGRAAESEGSWQGSGYSQPRQHAFHSDRHGDDLARRFHRQELDARLHHPAVAYAWVFGVAIVIVLAAAALIMRIRNVK